MFGILAIVAFGVAYVLDISRSNPPIALSPGALTIAGLFLLTAHLCGVGANWTINRRQ